MEYNEDLEITTKLQMFGTLWKKPFGSGSAVNKRSSISNSWTKRYFVVKEGFLLYYQDRKDFEKKRHFNFHPKGVIPLGGCSFGSVEDSNPKIWAFSIESEDFANGSICLATETEYEREKWIDILRRSERVTFKNAQLGDTMIQTLETQGLQLALESQEYRHRLQNEVSALRDEKDRNEELERINLELEKEKEKIELMAKELQEELERNKLELDETMIAVKEVEQEKIDLKESTKQLQIDIENLAKEKEKTLHELQGKEQVAEQLSSKNQTLSMTTEELKKNLLGIEEKTKTLEEERLDTERRLVEKEREAKSLEEEKELYSVHAKELLSSLHDLTIQKELTDTELREEIIARREAERRQNEAETALHRLEKVLDMTSKSRNSSVEAEVNLSVATLKKFFEDIAEEAKIDSDKPIIMKNALHARKSFVKKTRSVKYRKNRARSMDARIPNKTGQRSRSPTRREPPQQATPRERQSRKTPTSTSQSTPPPPPPQQLQLPPQSPPVTNNNLPGEPPSATESVIYSTLVSQV